MIKFAVWYVVFFFIIGCLVGGIELFIAAMIGTFCGMLLFFYGLFVYKYIIHPQRKNK